MTKKDKEIKKKCANWIVSAPVSRLGAWALKHLGTWAMRWWRSMPVKQWVSGGLPALNEN
jgi:hypothetical protein